MVAHVPKMFLRGVFRLEDKNGHPVYLRSAKEQGLLALVATSPNAERSRTWLQSMLWSDRGGEQASGSLRQALAQLRKVLEPTGISLEIDRRRVALDLSTVQVVTSGEGEFLEGIDVRDDEFESWLTTERSRRLNAPPESDSHSVHRPGSATAEWNLAIAPQSPELGTARLFENLLADGLSRSLRELYSAPIYVGTPPATTERLLVAKIQGFVSKPGVMTIRIAIDHPAAQRQVWAGFRDLPSDGIPPLDHPDLQQMVNELIEGLGDYLILSGLDQRAQNEPNRLFRLAIRALFTMDPTRVLEADAMFAQAMEMQPRGLYLAWRMQLRQIQTIEKHPIDNATIVDECQQFYARALELEPNNSMVLATLANSLRRSKRDDRHSLFLAERSVRLNPANSFAWWAMSAASSYIGNAEDAYRNAQVGRRMALLSPHRFWWDNRVYTSALMHGKTSEALKYAEATHAANPDFRPPLRYLVALYANNGKMDEAARAAEKLRHLEPDFTIDRLLMDRSYPASLIHSAPNLNLDRIASLI